MSLIHQPRKPVEAPHQAGDSQLNIDITVDFAIGMLIGGGVPTMNFRTDCLRPAIGEALTAVACVRRAGKTTATVEVELLDDEERLVALGRGTYSAILG